MAIDPNESEQRTDNALKRQNGPPNTYIACTAFNCRYNLEGKCNLARILLQQIDNDRQLSCANFEEKVVPPEQKGTPDMPRFQRPEIDIAISLLPALAATRIKK